MAFDQNALPPMPYKTELTNERGFLTEPWSNFIRQLYIRVGGAIALSNVELEELQATELVDILNDISTLQTLTASQAASIVAINASLADQAILIDGLNQGRQL